MFFQSDYVHGAEKIFAILLRTGMDKDLLNAIKHRAQDEDKICIR